MDKGKGRVSQVLDGISKDAFTSKGMVCKELHGLIVVIGYFDKLSEK